MWNFIYNIQLSLTFSLMFNKLKFGKHDLIPVEKVGIRGIVSDISLEASAKLSYKYMFFKDTTSFRMKASGMDFDMTLQVGRYTRLE